MRARRPPHSCAGLRSATALAVAVLTLVGCTDPAPPTAPPRSPTDHQLVAAVAVATVPQRVIYDTDMNTDVDDVGALAVLHAMADLGEAQILGVMINDRDTFQGATPIARCAMAINAWYNRPNIRVGQPETFRHSARRTYPLYCAENFPRSDVPVENATTLYRSLLTGAPDKSVVLISVGFTTNVADLMRSTAAAPGATVDGMTLIRNKVKLLSIMGGRFNFRKDEFNFVYDSAAANHVITNWPANDPNGVEITYSGSEIGAKIQTGGTLLTNARPRNPVREAYRIFHQLDTSATTGTATHSPDLSSVFYGVRGNVYGGLTYWGLWSVGVARYAPISVADDPNGSICSFGGPPCRIAVWDSAAPDERQNYLKNLATPPAGASSVASLLNALMEAAPRLPSAYWPLGANANDFSGHARHGTAFGNVAFGAVGKRGNAATFDGSGGYIAVPDASATASPLTTKNHRFGRTDSYTLAAWVYPTHATALLWRGVVTKSRDGGPRYGIWITNHEKWGADTQTGAMEGTSTVVRNAWTHVAVVQDGRAGTRKLYVNGTLEVSGAAAAGDGAGPLWIGGGASLQRWFQGKIDDVRIYERALPEADVDALAAP